MAQEAELGVPKTGDGVSEESERGAHPEATAAPKQEGAAPESEEEAAERARAAFRAAQQAFAEGRFVQSAKLFDEAHQLHPHAAVLFNVARAWHQAEELERAADAYAAAIKRGELEFSQANLAQQTLEELRARLGWAKFTGAPGVRVTVGHVVDAPLPLELHLAPGEHAVSATDESGNEWTQTVVVEADQPRSLVVAPPPKEAPVPALAPVVVVADNGARDRQIIWGAAAVSGGAGLGIVSAVLGASALHSKKKYEASDPLDPELYSRTKGLRTWTNVTAFTGLVVGGTGLVLLLTLPKKNGGDETPEVGLAFSPDRVSLAGQF